MTAKFDLRADTYSRFATIQSELASWLAQWLEPPTATAALQAFDLGAGEGLFTQLIAPRFAQLTAVDCAPRMVEQGRQTLPEVLWRVDDAWSLQSDPVDRLFSASLLQWCDEPVRVLRHWCSLAKPDAKMLHGFYVAPTLPEWESMQGSHSPIVWHNPQQWTSYFEQAGWRVLRSATQQRIMKFKSARQLLRFFHRTGAVVPRRTSVTSLRKMIADYDTQFALGNGDGGVRSTWTFFRIEAVKG